MATTLHSNQRQFKNKKNNILNTKTISANKKINYNMATEKFFYINFKNMIDLITPASGITEAELIALKKFPNLKFNILTNNSGSSSLPFLAANDSARLEKLKEALYNNPEHIIWCARGGYGSARLIEELIKLPKPAVEKLFIGYSDITALHLFLAEKWGWKTIHGAVPIELIKPEKNSDNFSLLAKLVNKEVNSCNLDDLIPINNSAKENKGNITGLTTGGNLTLLQTSIGTNWQLNTKNKILFIEDVNLSGYQIDRALNHLLQAGCFNEAKAIIFGHFEKGDDYVNSTILNFANTMVNIPVFKSNQFGHGTINRPIIYNSNGEILLNKNTTNYELIMKLK